MVHLRLAACLELLQIVPSYCLALDLDGHRVQLPCTSPDAIRMHTPGTELELRVYRGEPLLGKGHTRTILYPGYQQHHHRRSVYGCASDLPFARPVEQSNSTGYQDRFPAEYPVSNTSVVHVSEPPLTSHSATICSIFKTIELKAITKTQDPTWDGVNLTIWSSSELSIGILIASLPPLRKAFDHLFKKFMPSTLTGSGKTPHYGYGNSSVAQGNSIHMKNFQGSKAYHSRLPGESILDGDDESDRAILDDDQKGSGIMKSTDVQVTVTNDVGEAGSSSNSKSGGSPKMYNHEIDWASPHLENGEGPRRSR